MALIVRFGDQAAHDVVGKDNIAGLAGIRDRRQPDFPSTPIDDLLVLAGHKIECGFKTAQVRLTVAGASVLARSSRQPRRSRVVKCTTILRARVPVRWVRTRTTLAISPPRVFRSPS